MDKKIVLFLLILLSINSMLLVTGKLSSTSDSTTNFYSALPSEYQSRVGLGDTNTSLTGGESDMVREVLVNIPFIGAMFEASGVIFQTIELAGKLSFGYFTVIDIISPEGTGINAMLFIFLLPIGILQVIFMAYLFLYILGAVAGVRLWMFSFYLML